MAEGARGAEQCAVTHLVHVLVERVDGLVGTNLNILGGLVQSVGGVLAVLVKLVLGLVELCLRILGVLLRFGGHIGEQGFALLGSGSGGARKMALDRRGDFGSVGYGRRRS